MVSVKANVPLNSILDMSTKDAWLFVRGEPAKKTKKYNPAHHTEYVNVMDTFGEDDIYEAEETGKPEEKITFGFCV